MKKNLTVFLTLLLLLSLTACGGSAAPRNSASGGSSYAASTSAAPAAMEEAYWDAEMPMEMKAANDGASGSTGDNPRANIPEGVKMIYRANLELETTEYEKAQSDIVTLTNQLGGYFEDQSSNNYSSGYRSASYTVRVPAAQFDAFLHQIGELCRVRYQTQSAENVSERYYDMESRLETAKIKLDRLQDLLRRAEEMEDIITLESAISETEYQIESLSGELRHYDALIDYSTIYVNLQEVYKVTEQENAPLSFPQRLGNAFRSGLRDFGDFLEDLAEMLAYSWLSLLVIALLVFLIVKLFRRRVSGKKLFGKKAAPAEPEKPADSEKTE